MTSTDKTATSSTETMETVAVQPAAGTPADAPAASIAEPAAPPARGEGRGPSLPLGTRLLLLATGLIGIPLALAIGLTTWRAQEVAAQSVRDALEAAQATRVQFDQMRSRQSELIARLVANDPAFVAYVAEGHAPSTADLLNERRQSLGCDFALVLDRTGHLIAHTARPGVSGADLGQDLLVAQALREGVASGTWRDGDALYTAAAATLLSGGQTVEGVFVAGFVLDDAVALELKRMTGTEVLFVAGSAPGMRIVASTLGTGNEALIATLDPALPRALAGESAMLERVWLEHRAWGARIEPLRDAAGTSVGAVVTLASLDSALAPFRRIVRMLLLVGALSLLAALAASWAAARRLSRPLERLAAAADAARAGRLDVPIEAHGRDEVSRLAIAFSSLLADLRGEREMAAFLAARSRSTPEGAQARLPEGALAAGAVVGNRFEVLSVLGAGGMGVVYRAHDRELRDTVALKTLRVTSADDASLERLKAELRLARRITHRHVVRVHDFGQLDGVPFISMEFVPGVTLRELLSAGALPLAVSTRIARQVAAGLAAAHEAGVVHHDLKPENVVFEPGGSAKLMDFGLARLGRREADSRSFSGTLGYAAPEVMRGAEGGAASDVFAFGVMLQELLTGQRPWSGSDPRELIHRIMHEPPAPIPPGAVVSGDASALISLVGRCLAIEPTSRYADGRALCAALDQVSRS
jgi:serine/threonine-protein kinase